VHSLNWQIDLQSRVTDHVRRDEELGRESTRFAQAVEWPAQLEVIIAIAIAIVFATCEHAPTTRVLM
jgi:hypothetical protein